MKACKAPRSAFGASLERLRPLLARRPSCNWVLSKRDGKCVQFCCQSCFLYLPLFPPVLFYLPALVAFFNSNWWIKLSCKYSLHLISSSVTFFYPFVQPHNIRSASLPAESAFACVAQEASNPTAEPRHFPGAPLSPFNTLCIEWLQHAFQSAAYLSSARPFGPSASQMSKAWWTLSLLPLGSFRYISKPMFWTMSILANICSQTCLFAPLTAHEYTVSRL